MSKYNQEITDNSQEQNAYKLSGVTSIPKNWNKFIKGFTSEFYRGDIEILGEKDFVEYICQALDLIYKKSFEAYQVIVKYIGQIREYPYTGMCVHSIPPICFLSRIVAYPSSTWAASCIAHEAYHSKLYNDYLSNNPHSYVPHEIYSGQKIELECNVFQLEVSYAINSPQEEIDWLKSQDGSHHDKGWGRSDLIW
jgi:hypothetical protein